MRVSVQRGGFDAELAKLEQSLEEALVVVKNTPRENLKAAEWLETAAQVGERLAECRDAIARVRTGLLGGARSALLHYLRGHAGEAVSPHKLEGVAAIRAWARRIRELREIGWGITMVGSGSEAPYRLTSDRLEESVASSDETIKSIGGSSPMERLIEYLLHTSPWPASPEQLERVAQTPTWRQEVRALIDDGWQIQSHDDDPGVPPGSFRLANIEA